MFKPKLPQQEQGFTLVEVSIAILITTLFVGVAMQGIVIAAIFKTKAQEYTEATTWIREDLENLQFSASEYVNSTRCVATAPNNGYADGLRDLLSGIIPETVNNNSLPESNNINSTKTNRAKKQYFLRRTTTPSSNPPYAVLEIIYDVSPIAGGSSIASLQSEVIPNGAFQCP